MSVGNLKTTAFLCYYKHHLISNLSGGEFGWGGTSVKMQHRCPKGSSERTETIRRVKG